MSERVFVSSTCYDLLDLRAEVEAHLRDLGLAPVLSDRLSSDFIVDAKADSIETCLVNVRAADVVVCILSQRYGPSLQKAGFADVSATHLEWLEAKSAGKPIYFYVRDQTLGEYATWKKNHGKVDEFAWVREARVFSFLEEHKKLVKAAGGTNWLWPFRDSVELKLRLTDDLASVSRKAILRRLLAEGALPIVTAEMRQRNGGGPGQEVAFGMAFRNRSAHPAVDVRFRLGETESSMGDLPGQGELGKTLKTNANPGERFLERAFTLEYQTHHAHLIQDDFLLRYDTDARDIGVTIQHVAKRLVGGPRFKIE